MRTYNSCENGECATYRLYPVENSYLGCPCYDGCSDGCPCDTYDGCRITQLCPEHVLASDSQISELRSAGWSIEANNGGISKTFTFNDFNDAWGFMSNFALQG